MKTLAIAAATAALVAAVPAEAAIIVVTGYGQGSGGIWRGFQPGGYSHSGGVQFSVGAQLDTTTGFCRIDTIVCNGSASDTSIILSGMGEDGARTRIELSAAPGQRSLLLGGSAMGTFSTFYIYGRGGAGESGSGAGVLDARVDIRDGSLTGGGFFLSAVPEPATWATMIGGFALVGGAMRRHRLTPAPR